MMKLPSKQASKQPSLMPMPCLVSNDVDALLSDLNPDAAAAAVACNPRHHPNITFNKFLSFPSGISTAINVNLAPKL